jgi:FkbM family methyltransferase
MRGRQAQSPELLDAVIARLPAREEALRRESSEFDRIAAGASKVVLVGSGPRSQLALAGAISAGFDVIAYTDNNPARHGLKDGIPVMSPQEAVARFNDDAMFLVTIYNGSKPTRQLRELGCRRVVPYAIFFWRFSTLLPSANGLELPHRIVEHIDSIRAASVLLGDARSREEYARQVQWRCTIDEDCLPPADPSEDMHYAADLVRLGDEEVFVDCGAFVGDSLQAFLNKTQCRFSAIYAFEPDWRNRAALQAYIALRSEDVRQRISVLPYAVCDRNGRSAFTSTGAVDASLRSSESEETIECAKLDDVLEAARPTFIKMDIEGSEPDAIRGAAQSLHRSRPTLSICAYHNCEHLWELPLLLRKILPDYGIYLRRYAEESWELVYYAVPSERIPPVQGNPKS